MNLKSTGHIATIVVVVVAFIVTYTAYITELGTAEGPAFSGTALAVSTVLGVFYLGLLISGFSPRRTSAWGIETAAYFAVLVGLMLAIEFLLAGAGGIWLISMPLIAAATTDLPPQPRWLIYIAALIGVAAPIYLASGSWYASFFSVLTFVTAFVFVIAFVKLNQSAELAQQNAEQLATQLADANRRLVDFAIQAEELATMQERNRLAREIHDNLGHYLTVANVQIKAAQALLLSEPERANVALDKAAQLTQEGLAAVRQSVSSLRESPLGRLSLIEAISKLANDSEASGIVTELHIEGSPRSLDPRVELTLYRTAQETLTNTRKHSRASRVDLTLDFSDPENISLEVGDNGIGTAGAEQPVGFGLIGIQERARQLGAHISTISEPGGGYSLSIKIPTNQTPTHDGNNQYANPYLAGR